MSKKIRWALARLLDEFKDTCWADLVMWAVYPEMHPFDEILDMRKTANCCTYHGYTPYCGKCSNTPNMIFQPS